MGQDFSTFRDNVRLLVLAEGISQRQLAAKIGVSQSHFSRVMSGDRDPSLDIVCAISRRYHRKMDDLLNKKVLKA